MTAIGHVCHKMIAVIFAVLRDNKPYVPASFSLLFIAGLDFALCHHDELFSNRFCRLEKERAALVWKDLLAIAAETEGSSVLMVPLCKSCEKNLRLSTKPLEEEKKFLVV